MKIFLETDEGKQELDVTADQVELTDDDPFVSQEKLNSVVKSRLSRERKNLRSKLKEDDEFFQKSAAHRGIELREDGAPKGSLRDEEIQSLKQRASKVDSLEIKVQSYENQIESVRSQQFENELLSAADGLNPDMQDVFTRYARDFFKYDEDYGWVRGNEDGIEYNNGEPVKPSDYVSKIKEEKPTFFDGGSPNPGPDLEASEGGSGKKVYTEQEFESLLDDPASLTDEEFAELTSAMKENRVR